MRIGIAGTHSVGKTTLLNALRSEPTLKHYTVCDEVTRSIRALGLQINEHGTDQTQNLIMRQHIVNCFLYDNMITDRTALDGYIYTLYLYSKDQVTRNTLDFSERVMIKLLPYYDIIFYIPIEFPLVSDGVRSDNERFRTKIEQEFERTIKAHNIPVIPLTGSVMDRVKTSIEAINDRQSR